MNAQDIINEVKKDITNKKVSKITNLKMFYPRIYAQKLTDVNITKCLRRTR